MVSRLAIFDPESSLFNSLRRFFRSSATPAADARDFVIATDRENRRPKRVARPMSCFATAAIAEGRGDAAAGDVPATTTSRVRSGSDRITLAHIQIFSNYRSKEFL